MWCDILVALFLLGFSIRIYPHAYIPFVYAYKNVSVTSYAGIATRWRDHVAVHTLRTCFGGAHIRPF